MDVAINPTVYFVDRHVVEGRGDRTAILCGDVRLTYAELQKNINRTANALISLGFRAGERVLVLLPDTPEFIESFLGAMKIGAVPVPLNTLSPAEQFSYFFNDSGATLLVTTPALLERMHTLRRDAFAQLHSIVLVGVPQDQVSLQEQIGKPIEFFEPLLNAASEAYEAAVEPAAEFWLYSSGSTGVPKACVHRGQDMIECAKSYAEAVLHMTPDDVCFSASKLFFSYGLGNSLYFPLSAGAAVVLMPEPPKPENIIAALERYHPTIFFSVPTQHAKLLEHASSGAQMFHSVRAAISAGEPLSASLFWSFKEKFALEILDCVGSTEAFLFLSNRPGDIRSGSGGKLLPGCEARIVDEAGSPVPVGEVGNLLVRSKSVFSGYWNQPEKTEATLRDGWVVTGDQFSEDADGFFWYAGRSDDMIKSSGAWVSPIEVEDILLAHPAILEVAVVGKQDENDSMKPMAFVVLRSGFQNDDALLAELHCLSEQKLPNYKRPRRIEVVKELPRTSTGKLQRFKLRDK